MDHSNKNGKISYKDIMLYIFCSIVITFSIFSVITVYSKKTKLAEEKIKAKAGKNGYNSEYKLDPLSGESFTFWDGINLPQEPTTEISMNNLPNEATLELSLINQYPELPSGCEAIALTMVLNYYGYNLDKLTIADRYLIKSNDNFLIGFKGDPHSKSGGGAYSPSITNTANRFLIESGDTRACVNVSGTELEELFPFIAQGNPVIVWTTINGQKANPSGPVYRYGDTEYQWVSQEHCVVLTGYNLTKNEITIYDSISGIVVYDKDEFKNTYNEMWKMAVVIQ